MKHPPYIKNFYDKVTVNMYYSMHCVQCVMVAKTTLHCVMGREITWMWQSAEHRLTRKVIQKSVYFVKRSVSTVQFLQSL